MHIIVNDIIDKDLNILILTSCVSDAILDDNVDFVTSDKSNPESPQRAPIQSQLNAPVIKNTPVITSQKTSNLPINTDKLGKIKENIMAMKSNFMNEIYELKKKYHCYDRSMAEMKVKNRKIVILLTFWKLNSYFLRKKIQFYVQGLKIHKKELSRF